MTLDALKAILAERLTGRWGDNRYWIFQDASYDLVPRDTAKQLLVGAPVVRYVNEIYDCDDHALEFKAYVARTQATHFPQHTHPFCVGYARGRFEWIENGTAEHVANFVVCEDKQVYWTDLQLREWRTVSNARQGSLSWLIL